MMVLYSIRMTIKGKQVESPNLITGDITDLEKLFPKCPFWKARTEGVGNIYYPTTEQAKALYLVIVEYYAKSKLRDQDVPGGNFTGSFWVTTNQTDTFDELIEFFEGECGFKAPKVQREKIRRKQAKRLKDHDKAQWDMIKALDKMGTLYPPTSPEIRRHLEMKLAEYRQRLNQSQQHPKLAIQVDPNYRDAVYKIYVVETILTDGIKEIPLGALAASRIAKDEDTFDPETFVNACGVIAIYLGTPIKGLKLVEKV